jgi:hypothetical protein
LVEPTIGAADAVAALEVDLTAEEIALEEPYTHRHPQG